MAKPRKEGLSHTTIRIKWTDKAKLRSLAVNNKEADWSVISRLLTDVQARPRDVEIGVVVDDGTIPQPSGSSTSHE